MNSCVCVHKIELDNLENDEIISHTILLIKGHIHQQKSSILPTHATKKCTEQQILLILKQPLAQHEVNADAYVWELQQKSIISRNGHFKLLCDLAQYVSSADNVKLPLQLEFRFCNALYQLEIVYQSATSNHCYRLQPLYITCSNQNATSEQVSENCEKINLNLRLIQCVYSELLRAAGFSRQTFVLNGECKVFGSRQTCEQVWQQSEDSLWQNFAQELLDSTILDGEIELKFVAFIGVTKYDGVGVTSSGDFSYANIRRHLEGHAALGGGGLALFGTAYLYAWPQFCKTIQTCFASTKHVDLARFPDDSNYRRTFGGVYATTLGAVVHEIGHTFDLGHTKDGVMGNGLDYINRVFTVDNLTENLPDRIIHQAEPTANAEVPTRSRFTQVKRSTNTFLNKYHEQKSNDFFYFTRNCALILSKHKWLRNQSKSAGEEKARDSQITYDAVNACVISSEVTHPMCLIEVRCVQSSFVKYWYELHSVKDKSSAYKFNLPREALEALENNHYLFVLTQTGLTKRLCEC